MIFRTFF